MTYRTATNDARRKDLNGNTAAQQQYLPFRGVQNDTASYLQLDHTLKEIRCVSLQSGSKEDPLLCVLAYNSMKSGMGQRPYEALSYCWGDVDDTCDITLYCARDKDYNLLAQDRSLEHLQPIQDAPSHRRPGQEQPPPQKKRKPLYSQQKFKVTRNLHNALRALRRPSENRIIWIDAICIDQGNIREKSHQVSFMHEVYSSAESVVVWLGEEDEHTRLTVQTCNFLEAHNLRSLDPHEEHELRLRGYDSLMLGKYIERLLSTIPAEGDNELLKMIPLNKWRIVRKQANFIQNILSRGFQQSGGNWTDWIFQNVPRVIAAAILQSLDKVLSRPWYVFSLLYAPAVCKNVLIAALMSRFRRIWVLQEVFKARKDVKMITGDATITWNSLCITMRRVHELANLSTVSAPHISISDNYKDIWWFYTSWYLLSKHWRTERLENTAGPLIIHYLKMTTHFQASDPRDKLYALLNIASDTYDCFVDEPLIAPDYSKTLEEVVVGFNRWYLEKRGLVDVMIRLDFKRQSPLARKLPTWCSDILFEPGFEHFLIESVDSEREISPGRMKTKISHSDRSISIFGHHLATIEHILTPDLQILDDGHRLVIAERDGKKDLMHYLLVHCRRHLGDKTVLDACRNLKTMLNAFGSTLGLASNFGLHGTNLPPGVWHSPLSAIPATVPLVDRDSIPWHEVEYLGNRRVFATSDGTILLGHKEARPGDSIVHFEGSVIPLIAQPVRLRKTRSPATVYRFLGSCVPYEYVARFDYGHKRPIWNFNESQLRRHSEGEYFEFE